MIFGLEVKIVEFKVAPTESRVHTKAAIGKMLYELNLLFTFGIRRK